MYIEDYNLENWQLFCESQKNYYYVSDKGRVKYKQKSTKNEVFAKIALVDGKATIRVNKKHVLLKNLVAKNFASREYKKTINPVVINVDGNPYNCNIENLKIMSLKEFRNTFSQNKDKPCSLYKNGKLVKTFKSIREAGKNLYYDPGDISAHFNKGVPKTLPFDLRLE